jgi:hypothetical protein
VAYTGLSPFSKFTGVAIVRSQADMDRMWALLQGRPEIKNAVSPMKLGVDEQFIVVVAPKEFGFDAQMMVGGLAASGDHLWNLEIVPQPYTWRQGMGVQLVTLIVRTKTGPDAMDVLFRGPGGDTLAVLRCGKRREPALGLWN